MRRLLTTAAAVALLPAAASAQDKLTLWDVFSLDRLVQSGLQSVVGLVRTQMDLVYEDLSVDLRRSKVTMSGITAWPFFDWDFDLACQIDIDSLSLSANPINQIERVSFKARITGMTLQPACLPEEMQEAIGFAGLSELTVPRMTFDVDYGVPGSDALIRMFADVADVGTIDAMGDFSYFWFDGRDDMEEPEPVWFLRRATLAIENKGIWEAVSGELPPFVTDPASLGGLSGMMREGLLEMAREGNPDASTITDEQQAFLDSAMTAWEGFLANPESLVLETGIDGDAYIDIYAIEDDPAELFYILQPTVALVPARVTEALSADLLRAAMSDDASLTDADRLTVGEALISGVGAPRNVAEGMKLLMPLAEGGDPEAALMVAEALSATDANAAYLWALRAGRAGAAGAAAMLDTLERDMAFATVLQLQDQLSGNDSHPGSALRTVSTIRDQAAMRLSGVGMARHYGIAAMWAMLAKAAGDPEAADILQEIDVTVELEGTDAAIAWAEVEAEFAALAMEVWIGQNLPARYAE